jgi:beta-lactamase class A
VSPSRADRRQLLAGLAALPLTACAPGEKDGSQSQNNDDTLGRIRPPSLETIDFSGLEANEGGRLGFAIHDIDGKRLLSWRGDERFVYCSTFKMYLAAATLLRVQAGEERLDRELAVTRADILEWAPVTEAAVDRSLSVETLLRGAMEVSDGTAANLLLRAMGGPPAMQSFYRRLGDQTTRADRYEPELVRLDGDKDTIMPGQSLANMTRLFSAGSLLEDASQSLLLRWMLAATTGAARIKAGVPAGWRVAHKTGTGGYGPVNDIGLIYPPSGRPLIIAVYYHATRQSDEDRREWVIAEATRTALKALGRD